jgi:hypothetical protein
LRLRVGAAVGDEVVHEVGELLEDEELLVFVEDLVVLVLVDEVLVFIEELFDLVDGLDFEAGVVFVDELLLVDGLDFVEPVYRRSVFV